MALRLRRGTESERSVGSFVPLEGEPIYTTDTKRLYIGDGVTPGGVEYTSIESISDISGITLSTEISRSLSQYTIASNVVSVTLVTSHDYEVGDTITISDSTVALLNGEHTITATPIANGFQFALVTANVATTSVSGSVSRRARDGEVLTYNAAGEYWTNSDPITSLRFLEDVNFTGLTLTNGMFLRYSTSLNAWTAETLNLTYSLDDLSDVTIATAANNQVLQYNSTVGQWRNVTLATIPSSIKDLSDVSDTSPSNGHVLQYSTSSNSYVPVSLSLDSLSDVTIPAAADKSTLIYDGASSQWKIGVAFDPLLLKNRYYWNVRDNGLSTSPDSYAIVYNSYLNLPSQEAIIPEYDPTMIVYDLMEGTNAAPTARSGFNKWTSTAGTGTRANGIYTFASGQRCDTWNRDTSSASPLDNILSQQVWFEIDVKYELNTNKTFLPFELIDFRGTVGTNTTERSLLALIENNQQTTSTKSKLYLTSFLMSGYESESSVTPQREGLIWYRICGTFNFSNGAYSIWVGNRDTGADMQRIMSGNAKTDVITGNWVVTSALKFTKLEIANSIPDEYYIDNVYVGVGVPKFNWLSSETSFPMSRTYGDRPKRGVVENSNIGNIRKKTITTTSIANGATFNSNTSFGNSGFLRRVTVDKASRIRLYISSAARTSDAARAFTTTPGRYIGLIFDHEFLAAGSINLTPCIVYALATSSTAEKLDVFLAIENDSGTTGTVTVDIEYTELEYDLF